MSEMSVVVGVGGGDVAVEDDTAGRRADGDVVTVALQAASEASRPTYRSYLNKAVAVWGSRRLDEVLPDEVRDFLGRVQATAVARRSNAGGTTAIRNAYQALSFLYRYAVQRGFLGEQQVVLRLVEMPRRQPSRRHAVNPELISQIFRVARETGVDPELDVLLLRFHLETAARTCGALALRVRDLDVDQSLVQLWEKGGTRRWQPVSPTLMGHLLDHARRRGARDDGDKVFRRLDRAPMTRKRYESLWGRLRGRLESVRVMHISTHWLRHTTVTWVERNFGYAVARAYAGHAVSHFGKYGSTHAYVKAGVEEIAAALQALTGERHPLAPPSDSATAVEGVSAAVGLHRVVDGAVERVELREWLRAEDARTAGLKSLSEWVLALYEEAGRIGRPRPGRDELVGITGASVYAVRAAQRKVAGLLRRRAQDELAVRIRRLYEEAEAAGMPRPNRGALAEATGATVSAVRGALARLGMPVREREQDARHRDLVGRIRRLCREAELAGMPRPGRAALMRATGESAHAVKLAQADIRACGGVWAD